MMSGTLQLLDAVIGLDTHVRVLALAEELQKSTDPALRAKAQDLYRHSRGLMAATAAIAERLNGAAR
jgi:hypothetical protein